MNKIKNNKILKLTDINGNKYKLPIGKIFNIEENKIYYINNSLQKIEFNLSDLDINEDWESIEDLDIEIIEDNKDIKNWIIQLKVNNLTLLQTEHLKIEIEKLINKNMEKYNNENNYELLKGNQTITSSSLNEDTLKKQFITEFCKEKDWDENSLTVEQFEIISKQQKYKNPTLLKS